MSQTGDYQVTVIVTPWSQYFVFSLLFWSGQGVTWVYLCGVFCLGVFVGIGIVAQWDFLVYGCLEWFSIRVRCLSLSLIGSHIQAAIFFECFVGDCSCLCVCFAPVQAVRFSCYVSCFCTVRFSSLLKMYENYHAAFWSSSPSSEENPNSDGMRARLGI